MPPTPRSAERAALLPHILCFELQLIDVSGGRASRLVEQALTALGKVVLWCLSVAGDDARLEREIGRIAAALDEVLRAPHGLAAIEARLRYLVATHARFGVQKVGKLLEKTASAPPRRGALRPAKPRAGADAGTTPRDPRGSDPPGFS